ncbi:hypothetical protein KCU98_g11055, partial [Aureobasidium melanogenum]
MPSRPHYMNPTISSQAAARAATRAIVASSTKVNKQVSRPVKPLPRPALPSAATQTTFSARQRAAATPKPAVAAAVFRHPVVTAPRAPAVPVASARRPIVPVAPAPRRPVVTAPSRPVVSTLTAADRIRINKLIPAIEEDFARVREEYCGEIRRTCEHKESDWDEDLLCQTDDESEITIFDKTNMVKRSFDSGSLDPSFFSPSDSGLARILDEFSDDVFNNDATDDDRVFFNDDTVIHHRIASSAYPDFADFDVSELEEEEDASMAALEELSFVEVSPFISTNLPVVSPSHSLVTNIEDGLVTALGQMNLVDPVIGEGSDFLFSPVHSSFLSRHPSFLEDN